MQTLFLSLRGSTENGNPKSVNLLKLIEMGNAYASNPGIESIQKLKASYSDFYKNYDPIFNPCAVDNPELQYFNSLKRKFYECYEVNVGSRTVMNYKPSSEHYPYDTILETLILKLKEDHQTLFGNITANKSSLMGLYKSLAEVKYFGGQLSLDFGALPENPMYDNDPEMGPPRRSLDTNRLTSQQQQETINGYSQLFNFGSNLWGFSRW